ncbi:MAG: CDGSH iron-sulfur domain-containing protein [Candidatus Aminicenantaceae bacterium]
MDKDGKPTITPTRHGPLLVKNLKKLINSKGDDLDTNVTMTLCRCGKSKNKPFCDGAHLKNGFSDKKDPDRIEDKMDDYEGKDITIHDNRGVCSHREYCTDYAPKVFRRRVEPWIDPDAQNANETGRVIKMCSSGALSYTKDGALFKDWDNEPTVIISKGGPYEVQGYVELNDPDGNEPESKEHYTLCRCGHSKNKPFCDGNHWHVKFKDPKN